MNWLAFVASLVVAVVDYFFAMDLQHHVARALTCAVVWPLYVHQSQQHVAHALAPSCGVVWPLYVHLSQHHVVHAVDLSCAVVWLPLCSSVSAPRRSCCCSLICCSLTFLCSSVSVPRCSCSCSLICCSLTSLCSSVSAPHGCCCCSLVCCSLTRYVHLSQQHIVVAAVLSCAVACPASVEKQAQLFMLYRYTCAWSVAALSPRSFSSTPSSFTQSPS